MLKRTMVLLILLAGSAVARPDLAPYGIEVSESEMRFIFGMHSFAVDLELGRRGPADFARAAQAYRKAAVLGLPLAQNNLARLYETGRGVPKDAVAAYMWYLLAAGTGDPVMLSNRDRSGQRLTPNERAAAERLAQILQQHLPLPRR